MAENFDPKKRAELQNESNRIQKEYNETLKVSQSLSSAINDAISSQIDYRTELGKQVKKYQQDLQSSITKLETSEDVSKKLIEIEAEKERISKSYFGANKAIGEEKLKSLNIAEGALKVEHERLVATEQVDKSTQEFSNNLQNSLDGLLDKAGEIPIIGGMFKSLMSGPVEDMKKGITNAGKSFVTDFRNKLDDGVPMMNALKSAGGGAMKALRAAINPVTLGILAIGAAILFSIQRFNEIQQAAKKFREETGLLNSQTQGLVSNIETISHDMANIGVSAEDVSKAASAFVNEFDKLEQPSQAVLTSMVTLNKNFGIGVEEASKLNKVFQNIGGLSATQSQLLIGQTAEMAKMADVAPQQVIKDMADSAGEAYKFFGGMPEELAKAAVSAAKMGTSIKEAANVANSLLDYESSVTKELEASSILQTNLNFSRARQLAATNDILGAQQAVLDEVSTLGDLTRLNVFEQQALVEATGMELDSLVNQQRIRERFGKLQGEQLEAAMSLVNAGVDITNATEDDLIAQQKRLASQKELQSITENISNQFNALKTALSAAFMPLVTFVMPIVSDIITALNVFLMPLLKGIGAFLGIAGGILSTIYNVFRAILGPVFKFIGAIAEGFVTPLMKAKELLDPILNQFSDLGEQASNSGFTKALESIGKVIGEVLFYLVAIGSALVGGPITAAVSIVTGLVGAIGSIFGRMEEGGKYLQDVFTNIASGIGQFFSSIDAFFSFGKKGEQEFQSVVKAGVNFLGQLFLINSFLGTLGKRFTSVFSGLGKLLTAPFRMLLSPLKGFSGMVGKFLITPLKTFSSIGGKLLTAPFKMLSSSLKLVSKLLLSPFKLLGKLGGLITKPFSLLTNKIGGLGKVTKTGGGFFTRMFKGITKGITSFAKTFTTILTSVAKGIGRFMSGIASGIGKTLSSIGKGMGGFFKGMASGLSSLANPAALLGLGAIVLGIMGIATALRIAGPYLESFGKMIKTIFEGVAAVVLPIVQMVINGITNIAGTIGQTIIGVFDSVGNTLGLLLDKVTLDKVAGIMALGPALVSLAAGMTVLTAGNLFSNLAEGIGGLFGGESPSEKLEKLAQHGTGIAILASGMELFSQSIGSVMQQMDLLDIEKFEKFADASGDALNQAFDGANVSMNVGQIQKPEMDMDGSLSAESAGLQEVMLMFTETTTNKNNELIQKLDELKQAYMSNKDIYMDKEKVSSNVLKQNERSSENIFGLGFS